MLTLILMLALTLPGRAQHSEFTGWYDLAPRHKVLVTWAPDGGELRIMDFDSLRFHRLVPTGDSSFAWRRGADSLVRVVRFVRDASGAIAGFSWRGSSDSGYVRRSVEFPFDQEQVRFRSDSLELSGTLLVPRVRRFVGRPGEMRETPLTVPGAVIIHGSGTSDRDNVWAYYFAQFLAKRDIAVLLPDKRGSGGSSGDWRSATFEDLARDAIAAARVLAAHPKVDTTRLGFVGLSQGGWIAPLAARTMDAAFAVSVSGAAVTPATQVRHEIAQDLRRAGVPDSSAAAVVGLFDLAIDYSRSLSDTAWQRYHSTRSALNRGSMTDVVAPFPAERDHWQWRWWNGVADFDPIPHWRGLGAPALVIYGALDSLDNVPVHASVERLRDALVPERNRRNVIRVFSDLGHTLADPKTRWISAEALDLLARWITSSTLAPRPPGRSGQVRDQHFLLRDFYRGSRQSHADFR